MTQANTVLSDNTQKPGSCSEERLRSIIAEFPDIPPQVREASFTRVDERVIDEPLLRFLTEYCLTGVDDDLQAAKIKRRAEALTPYLGRTLVCVLIMLPGVRYTIEVDCCEERVVHWEWQPG